MDYNDLDHLRLAWVLAATVVALISQYTLDSLTHLMPNKTSTPTPQVHWNHEETAALVRFLHDNQHEAGDNRNFKMATYQAATLHITNYHTDGPPKNYQVHVKQVFEDFVKSHPLIHQFKTSGWDLYPYIADIIPHGGAHGANTFSLDSSNATTDSLDNGDAPAESAPSSTPTPIEPTSTSVPADSVPVLPLVLPGSDNNHFPFFDNPPSTINLSDISIPPSSAPPSSGKRSHTKMLGDDKVLTTMSIFPYANASDISATAPASNKHANLSAALDYAKSSHSCHSHNPPPLPSLAISNPIMVGLQGLINFLTSLINTLMTSAINKVSTMRAQAIHLLDDQDQDFPSPIKAFI
ncbi:hypothetical protein BKA82DRAFT_4361460 [Pisolithus tinctorius]|nr:hypothetical protein BKA82DRAFT_4361460 [Pisolithus tinctorius]